MKFRSDFVTNSSSSSFVIAYQKCPELDSDTLAKYPFLKNFNKIIETILFTEGRYNDTTAGHKIETIEDLNQYFLSQYSWQKNLSIEDILEDDAYLAGQYHECVAALEKGSNIVIKRVDYSDDTITSMIKVLASGDMGFELIVDGE